MNTYGSNYRRVLRDDIRKFQFTAKETLDNEIAVKRRKNDLYKAMVLGASCQYKVKIIFEAEARLNCVEAAVWFATDNDVNLKNGINIPVHCIREVIF